MAINQVAPVEGTGVGTRRRVALVGLPPAQAEIVGLMFAILGWEVADMCADCLSAAPPRLLMEARDGIIHVRAGDPALASTLAPVLAANGLDRLVMPVSLPALEQLMVVAG